MSSQVCKDIELDAIGRQLNPTLPPDAFANWRRPCHGGVTLDAVPEQSWLLKPQ